MVLVGGAFFVVGSSWGQVGFLVLILFSRVGLYGFSLGEMQIRQEGIRPSVPGLVNGFANALTGVATLVLFCFRRGVTNNSGFQVSGVLVNWLRMCCFFNLYSLVAARFF